MSETAKEQAKVMRKARHKLAFKLVEYIAEHATEPGSVPVELDSLAKDIETLIPLTYAEADIEMDALRGPVTQPTGPSMIAKLKEVLGTTDLGDTIQRATSTAEKYAALQSLVVEYLAAKEACDDVMESYDYEAEPPVTKEEYQQAEAVVEEKLQALRAAVPN